MKTQDKELLFKAICGYLPYGINVKTKKYSFPVELTYLTKDRIADIKPYLRPMESMTDKEKEEINELFESESSFLSPVPTWYVYEENIEKYVDFCLSHRLDWRGLIPKGLAIEAPADMYND